jgi:hypothetical protein
LCCFPSKTVNSYLLIWPGSSTLVFLVATPLLQVCCFPSKMVNSYLSGLDIAIAPDVMEEFSYAMVDYLGGAVMPAEEAAILDLYEKGRRDGTAWAKSVGLVKPLAPADKQRAASSAA